MSGAAEARSAATTSAAVGPRRARRATALLALAAGVAGCVLVARDLGVAHFGVPWDEAVYHEGSRLHVRWLLERAGRSGALEPEVMGQLFKRERVGLIHPPFSRLLSGAGWLLLHRGLGVDEVVALRLHHALIFGLLAAGVALAAGRRWGLRAATVGALLLLADVRLFGHAHTAQTDLTLTGVWLAATLALASGATWRHVVAAGLLAGLALATKLTGVLLVVTLAGWLALRGRRGALQAGALALAALVGAFAVTPPAWADPVGWTTSLWTDFRGREQDISIPTLFLGERYGHRVPWYVPGAHVLITTPLPLLGLAAYAVGARLRPLVASRSARAVLELARTPAALLAASALAPLAASSLPQVPAHDLERLSLPLHPFLALAAAAGFTGVVRAAWFRRLAGRLRLDARGGALALALVACAPAVWQAARQHPYPLTYFNALVGGTDGAQRLGFDVAYLKQELNGEALEMLNRRLPPGASLTANFVFLDLIEHQRAGRLREDIQLRADGRAQFVLIHGRRSWMSPVEEELFRRRPPLWTLSHRGAVLLALYALE